MASTETGEMFTQEQYDRMSPFEREELGLVRITPQEEQKLTPMSLTDRRDWLRQNKNSKRVTRKRERQNRKAGRHANAR